MKRRRFLSMLILLMLYGIASFLVDNSILLPSLHSVATKMVQQMNSSSFYLALSSTLLRLMQGYSLSLVVGLLFGYLCAKRAWIDDLFSPIASMLKTIPNISYMIVLLIVLGSENAVLLIIFLICFPIIFESVKSGVRAIPADWLDVLKLYPESSWNRFKSVYVFSILPYFLQASQTALGLGFKVAIMAEVLGQPRYGIGKSMHLSKLYLHMDEIFAWTLWIILFGLVFDGLFEFGTKILRKRWDF